MKNTRYIVTAGFVLALLMVLTFKQTNSSIVQPAAGNNGAPNTIPPGQTCGHCHSGGAQQNAVPNVDFTFNDGVTSVHVADFEYEPGKTYLISFIPLTTSRRYGFQISALKSGNTNGGTFALTDPAHTTIVSTPTTYVSHHNASSFRYWLFNWTAPATDVGDITFYYAFNAADSSNTDSGDTIYVGSSTIHALNTGINKIPIFSNLSVYPNPVENLLNVSLALPQTGNIQLNLLSIQGQWLKTLDEASNVASYNSTVNLSNISAGIYMLQIKSGDKTVNQKIVVQ